MWSIVFYFVKWNHIKTDSILTAAQRIDIKILPCDRSQYNSGRISFFPRYHSDLMCWHYDWPNFKWHVRNLNSEKLILSEKVALGGAWTVDPQDPRTPAITDCAAGAIARSALVPNLKNLMHADLSTKWQMTLLCPSTVLISRRTLNKTKLFTFCSFCGLIRKWNESSKQKYNDRNMSKVGVDFFFTSLSKKIKWKTYSILKAAQRIDIKILLCDRSQCLPTLKDSSTFGSPP